MFDINVQLGLVREAQDSERKRKRVRMICRDAHAVGCSLTHVRVAGKPNETEMRQDEARKQENGNKRRLRAKVGRRPRPATTRWRRKRRRRKTTTKTRGRRY